MGFACRLGFRGKLAVGLDTPGSHGALVYARCLGGCIVGLVSICYAVISGDGSLYTSCTPFSSMKSEAKPILESTESSRDRATVRTFPWAMPDNSSTLSSSGSVAREQLLEDIREGIQVFTYSC